MRNAELTLAAGVALIVAAGAVTLTRSPPRVVRAVGHVKGEAAELDFTTGDLAICQGGEALPSGVSGIRLTMRAFYGVQVHVAAYGGSRVLTEGGRGADWTGQTVTVPVDEVDRTSAHVRLCFALGPNSEPVVVLGSRSSARQAAVAFPSTSKPQPGASAGRTLSGRVGVEYLASGRESWWSLAVSVARRFGLGRAFSGTWIALLVAALMVAVGALAVRLALRELP
jgi:hypothetical protein